MKLTRYKTFVLSCYPKDDIILDHEWELKKLRKLVYDPENTVVLNELKNRDGAKSYQVIKDDKLMIAIVFFFNTDQKIDLNKTDFLSLFKTLSLEVTRSMLRKEGKPINPISIGEFKNFYKELNSNNDTYVWHYYNDICNNFNSNFINKLDGNPDQKFIDHILKPYNITIIQPRIPWKEQNLIWLKTEIENKEFIITEQGHLTVVDGIAYGSVETILNWRNILPKNSWKLISDEPIPVRVRPVVQVESVYDAEYMKAYYARKEDKYKMKIKIQSEAYKFGMSYKDYRRQYYPDFTFSDEKVKFSVVRPQQGVPLIPVVTVQTTRQSLATIGGTVPVKPKFEVKDLLTAYLTIPI
jgi:hypothetical protein